VPVLLSVDAYKCLRQEKLPWIHEAGTTHLESTELARDLGMSVLSVVTPEVVGVNPPVSARLYLDSSYIVPSVVSGSAESNI
jgi:hypothetical protein